MKSLSRALQVFGVQRAQLGELRGFGHEAVEAVAQAGEYGSPPIVP